MSTSDVVSVGTHTSGVCHVDNIPAETRALVSKLLQVNHDQFHIFWETKRGMHNHQVHYLLTDLALGATPHQIQEAFDSNGDYMRPIHPGAETAAYKVNDENYSDHLGNYDYYGAWLQYFSGRIEKLGWQAFINYWMFSGTPEAEGMIVRMFEGSLHPIIHLGFGVEFAQPAIVAEAFAQAAVHPQRASKFLQYTQTLAKSSRFWTRHDSLKDVFTRARTDSGISEAPCWAAGSYDRNRDFWADLPRAFAELASSYKLDPSISPEEFHMRTAEFWNVTTWFVCAAQRRDKQAKFDFYLMHCLNCSIFFSAFEAQTWLAMQDKVRMLELMVRMALVFYVCQGSPELLVDEIENYQPRHPDRDTWPRVIDEALKRPDDGHIVKFTRALNNARVNCAPFVLDDEFAEKFPIKDDMFLKIANMVLDSTENCPTTLIKWLRGYKLPDSWSKVPNKAQKNITV